MITKEDQEDDEELMKLVQDARLYHEYIPVLLPFQKIKYTTVSEDNNNTEKKKNYKSFQTFSQAVDEYYSKIEILIKHSKFLKSKNKFLNKLTKVQISNKNHIKKLILEQELNLKKAQLLEQNIQYVEKILEAINIELAKGLDWNELEQHLNYLKEEEHNELALLIHKLDLKKNSAIILLSENMQHVNYTTDELNDEISLQPIKINIKLNLNAYQNVSIYYQKKKENLYHMNQTKLYTSKKIEKTKEKISEKISKLNKDHFKIKKLRNYQWYEKFHWFISSENLLVISAKDKSQNILLIQKYLKKEDLFIYSQVTNSSTTSIASLNLVCIINGNNVINSNSGNSSRDTKEHSSHKVLPYKTIEEASCLHLCLSPAWKDKSKQITAFWGYYEQIKLLQDDKKIKQEIEIVGKKNFIAPTNMIMGFGILFALEDEQSIKNHLNDRKLRIQGGGKTTFGTTNNNNTLNTSNKETLMWEKRKEQLEKYEEKVNKLHQKKKKNVVQQNLDLNDDDDSDMAVTSILMDVDHVKKTSSLLTSSKMNEIEITEQNNNFQKKKKIYQEKKKFKDVKSQEKSSTNTINKNDNKKLNRRAKRKKKKLQKYKEQDEEDYLQAMKQMGLKPKTKKELNEKDSSLSSDEVNDDIAKTTGSNKTQANTTKATEDQTKTKKVIEEDQEDQEENLYQNLREKLDMTYLTGIPLAKDTCLFAVPVIAPYNVINQYKLSLKLVPTYGAKSKKGKIAKIALDLFSKASFLSTKQRQLIKNIDINRIQQNIPSCCRIAANLNHKNKGKKKKNNNNSGRRNR